MINSYTEKVLWKPTLINQYQLEGYPSSPYPSCDPIVIPKNTSRKLEVLLFNIFYKNNIFQSSLYRIGKAISPMCTQSGCDEETAVHLLFSCSSVPEELRSRSLQSYAKAVKCEIDDIDTTDIYTGFLNASRNSLFISSCLSLYIALSFFPLIVGVFAPQCPQTDHAGGG